MVTNSIAAPHLPVHLGSMSTCVRMQADIWKGKLKRGDVIVSNHPEFGGTHLPDITVTTPAFSGDEIIFYVASRAHHADIGGVLPGSMPPHSRELYQEGAAIESEKLVSEGKFNEKRITELLYDEPAQYPECSGTRCLADNINDLKAQIAANQKGINLISTLIEDYGEEVVQFYMINIQDSAELSVRNLLKDVSKRFEGQDLHAIDYMDDGSPIELKITINAKKGEAVFDFDGTGPEVYGNSNPFFVKKCNSFEQELRQHQRPRSRHLLGNNLLPTLPHLRRHPPQPRLPQTHRRPHPQEFVPLPLRQSSSRRRQRPHRKLSSTPFPTAP
jgi:5-oxoprolinase (ATP-hydrolysing)